MKEYWIWAAFWFVFGGSVGLYIGIWHAERTAKRERKERQSISDMVQLTLSDMKKRDEIAKNAQKQ